MTMTVADRPQPDEANPPGRISDDDIARPYPHAGLAAQESGAFVRRVVRCAADEFGIRQFIAQAPELLATASPLLSGARPEAVACLRANLRDPEDLMTARAVRETLDLAEPVALVLAGVLDSVGNEAHAVVAWLVDALAQGSVLAISHLTGDYWSDDLVREVADGRLGVIHPRSQRQFERFFRGLDVLSPGFVPVSEWRAEGEPGPRPAASDVGVWGAVGRKRHHARWRPRNPVSEVGER